MWGAQTLYCASLSGIYATIRLSPLDVPLCIYSSARGAIHATQAALGSQPHQPDTVVDALLLAIVQHAHTHTALVSLHWTREWTTTAGPDLTAEREAFRARLDPLARPPQELATTCWTLDSQPLDCDWLDAICTLQHD